MGARVFIPFGEFLPDRKLYGNQGLLRAFGVTPISGNYLQAPEFEEVKRFLAEQPFGMGTHQRISAGAFDLYAYYGAQTKLYEVAVSSGAEADRSRTAGGAYGFSTVPPGPNEMWWFTSYGDNVIATNFEDEVQFLATPGSGNFANMFTSTFKPQARFAFPIRQNLFLAYCFLPATFDGVASGTHPQLVCWTQNDNIRVAGSENVDPAHVGAGYQQYVGGDLGPITAGIGGDFGLIFLAGGIVRIDGPPYEFRTIVRGDTTLYPYSVFRLGDDVYFWGAGGPSVLPGGEAPVVSLTEDRMERSLLDNRTGFGADFAKHTQFSGRDISGGADPANKLARWGYLPISTANAGFDAGGQWASLLLDCSIRDRRLTVSKTPDLTAPTGGGFTQSIEAYFLRQAPSDDTDNWGPFRSLYGVAYNDGSWELIRFALGSEDGKAVDMELRTAFGRLSETHTTRIVAVRPVWSNSAGQAATIEGATTIQVHTKNKPWEDETDSDAHSTFNEDGWIGSDSTVVGTYHSITLKFDADTTEINEIHEIEGLEIEFIEGAEYGA